jgi:putative toxin-antitoxin system antitoxin component (TIGR02293 family)
VATVIALLDELFADEIVDSTDVARALGTTPRSVTRWQAADTAPRRETEERLLELKAVVDLLRRVLQPEPARLWLRSPHPGLDWQKPIDLVAGGEYRRVIGELLALAEGVTS